MTTPEQNIKEQESEAFIHEIDTRTRYAFPFLTQMDRGEFDSYDPSKDTSDRGQILWFYGEKGKTEGEPELGYIFTTEGYVIWYVNSPEPNHPYTIRNKGNSVNGPWQARWLPSQLEFAIAKAKIHMEGITHTDPKFLGQRAGWSEEEQRFVTMQERMEENERYLAQAGKDRKKRNQLAQDARLRTVYDLVVSNPIKAKELVVVRLLQQEFIISDDITMTSEEAIHHVRKFDALGIGLFLEELNKIEAYECLLKERGLL